MSTKVDGQKMRDLADMVNAKIPGIGFALLVFDFDTAGMTNYVSNAIREDMVLALRETLKRFEEGQTFPTPENA